MYVLLHVNKIYRNFHQLYFLYIYLWNKNSFLPGTDVKEKMQTLFSTIITMSFFVSVRNLKKDSDDRGNYFNMRMCLVYGAQRQFQQYFSYERDSNSQYVVL